MITLLPGPLAVRLKLRVLSGALVCACDPASPAAPHEPERFLIDPECSEDSDLELLLGDGHDAFEPIPPDGEPTLHFGTQGGQHLVLGVRIANPTPDHHGFRIEVRAEAASSCPDFGEPCEWEMLGQRSALALDPDEYSETLDGAIDIPNIFLVVSRWQRSQMRRIDVTATDTCGRSGVLQRIFYASDTSKRDS